MIDRSIVIATQAVSLAVSSRPASNSHSYDGEGVAKISAADSSTSTAAMQDHVTPAPLAEAGATAQANEASKKESPAAATAPSLEPFPSESEARRNQPSVVDVKSDFSVEPSVDRDVVLLSSRPAGVAPEKEKGMTDSSTPWAFAQAEGSAVRWLG